MKLEKTAADFFAGIGLVTMGLIKQGWQVKYALDYSDEKRLLYEGHFGVGHYHSKDIREISGTEVPKVTLAHASFPCTNVSVAGSRSGLHSGESSTFWDFVRLLCEMGELQEIGKPPFLLIENVEGLLTSGHGEDLIVALKALNNLGYTVDILVIDAAHFVPQSRRRLFIIGNLFGLSQTPDELSHIMNKSTHARPQKLKDLIASHQTIKWSLRALPDLPQRTIKLADIVDESLMGASEYLIPQNISLNNILFGFGDAVCVPVIEWLTANYLHPLFDEFNNTIKASLRSA